MRSLKTGRDYTNRNSKSLENYLKVVSTFPLLSSSQETEFLKHAKAGNLQALEKITKSNLRFVVSVAKKYQHQGLTLFDLINVGNLGLIQAAHRFNENSEIKFIAYALWWIRQSILLSISEHSRILVVPMNKISDLGNINSAFAKLEREYQREPRENEIAELLQSEFEDVAQVIMSVHKPVPAGDDAIDQEDSLTSEFLKNEIEKTLNTLPHREAQVLRMFFGLNIPRTMTLQQIGDYLNLSYDRVLQVRDNAIKSLQHTSFNNLIKAYLG